MTTLTRSASIHASVVLLGCAVFVMGCQGDVELGAMHDMDGGLESGLESGPESRVDASPSDSSLDGESDTGRDGSIDAQSDGSQSDGAETGSSDAPLESASDAPADSDSTDSNPADSGLEFGRCCAKPADCASGRCEGSVGNPYFCTRSCQTSPDDCPVGYRCEAYVDACVPATPNDYECTP